MRVLHLCTDWHLCNFAADIFTHTHDYHRFVFLRFWKDVGRPHKTLKEEYGFVDIGTGTKAYRALLRESWDVVWVHGLYAEKARFVLQLDPSVRVVWTTWGFDYLFYGVQWLFDKRTTWHWFAVAGNRIRKQKICYWLACHLGLSRLLRFVFFIKPHHRQFSRFLRRVDYFTVTVPTEEPFLRKLLGSRARRLDFHCMSFDPAPKVSRRVDLESKCILVGNSATITNNHYDVLPYLVQEKDYQVWAPLSYTLEGIKIDSYTRSIIRLGTHLLGNRFHPMTGFLPYEEYVMTIDQCSVYVFGHRRTQALGNVTTALYRGGCVFMNPVSPIYQYYTQNGIVIFPLSRLNDGIGRVVAEFRLLQRQNMIRIRKLRGHDKLLNEIFHSVRILRDDVASLRAGSLPVVSKSKWDGGPYRICFFASGGVGRMDDQRLVYGVPTNLKRNEYRRAGYEFLGWSLAPEQSIAYLNGDCIIRPPAKQGKLELFARWRGIPYRVDFVSNGGRGKMSPLKCVFGEAVQLPHNQFVRPRHLFLGWSLSLHGKIIWRDASRICAPPLTNRKVSLYAQWCGEHDPMAKWIGCPYKIIFKANGGTGEMSSQECVYGRLSRLHQCSFRGRPGQEFCGWAIMGGTGISFCDSDVVIRPPMKNGEIALLACWRASPL